ncbi:MAG: DnaA/Hda family protein [Desulfovibrionaceae bacterium]|nr:DnaA/Hda family protein [Desulfovibrionaceae bacterium]
MPVKDAPAVSCSSNGERIHAPFGEYFTLENFIINKKNVVSLALARSVAKTQREHGYNPLVYYGKSGSGKTHLLLAIANELSYIYGYHVVFYGNIIKFLHECEQHANSSGINKYQAYCIDDIHLFANAVSLQEKFMAFLDVCRYEKKQCVCACSETFHKGLSNNLRSRLEQGRVVRLRTPDIDVRMRFIQTQCRLLDIHISREHMLLLAQNCEHLQYITSVLLKIAAYKKCAQREIAKQDIEKILRSADDHRPTTPQDIIRQVAEYFSLSPEDIISDTRKPAPAFARQTAMYLCREILGASYSVIGQIFGGKDHSTVMYSIKKIEKYIIVHKNAHTEITKLKNICAKRHNEFSCSRFHVKLT